MALSVVIGGGTGIGLVIAQRLSARGDDVVVTSRDRATAEAVAQNLGPSALELGKPETIEAALADIGAVDNLVITAIEQAVNTVREFDIAQAVRSVTVKLEGNTEFLLANAGVNATDLVVDGGVLVT